MVDDRAVPDTTRPRLRCPLCEGERFDHEDGRVSIRNGSTDQRGALPICRTHGER
ncbi:hypothetical protein Daura_15510 [Dactylosporangium aurantiacum]|uniref:Uncharacterized protein n=1 Tax=Dactylosporangium aurantiacum TaxID=35754 RepID=A0A9Q9IKV9_9ACTN|nr:hypothetical protein [Dactylosporangium aurantiacum]MDG6107786.1 hypothetical protein [Dactylosporangium aurantiacum]UWZ57436.1 hypothetical protein Daura_15510 [Dactylosporangium aurantiacum]